jgi:hypothetical protein
MAEKTPLQLALLIDALERRVKELERWAILEEIKRNPGHEQTRDPVE